MTAVRVMMLIDADNVTADVIEQAIEQVIERHGGAHVRRAYCTAEAAVKQARLFKKLSVRPMVNISAGKNSTDIALAVDALDLAVSERPGVAVIVSSDSDFAPLVLRLREKGCRVEGYGQEGKVGEDTRAVYDHFVDLPHRIRAKAAKTPAKTARAAKAAPAGVPKAAPAHAPKAASTASAPKATPPAGAPKAANQAHAPKATGSPGATKGARAPKPDRHALPDDVQALLAAMPALAGGDWVALRNAAEPLRKAGLLGKTASSTKLFRKHPALFRLEPDEQPAKVRFVRPA